MDLFGSILLDHQRGVRDRPVMIRRDDGYVDHHDPGLYFAAEPQALEAEVLGEVAAPALDLGCGAGRIGLHLQARGTAVAGLDASPGAVEVCRRRGATEVRVADVLGDDLLAGSARPRTALLFGNNIGMAGTVGGTRHLLTRVRSVVDDDARLLFTSIDPVRTQNQAHLAYHEANRRAGRPPGQLRIRLEYQGEAGEWFDWLHAGPAEIEDLAGGAGWALERIVDAASGPYAGVLRAMA